VSAQCNTINATFAAAVAAQPERVYLDFDGDQYTYAQLDLQVSRFARGLHALGIARGDRVASVLDNSASAIIAWFAVNRIGAIHVPINTAYNGDYLRHQLGDSGARLVICDPDYLGQVLAVAADLPDLERILHTGTSHAVTGAAKPTATMAEYLLDEGDLPGVEVAPSDLAMLLYTSGTTGLSKGCMVSHNYLCDVSRRYCATIGRTADDRMWLPMPLFHITGISAAILTMQLGSSVAFARKFSLSNTWPEIERTGATFIVLLGTMALMVANAADDPAARRCNGQVRTLIGIPMNDALAAIWRERFGITWCSGKVYGSTEAGQALNANFDQVLP
jgi:crotonobetaine/carnitine-CoA ligase